MISALGCESLFEAVGNPTATSNYNDTVSYDINLPYKPQSAVENERARLRTEYPDYLPHFDKDWFEKLPEFEYQYPALKAEKMKPDLLKPDIIIRGITLKMETTLVGVNLQKLSDVAKAEWALLLSERKIVVFRDEAEVLRYDPAFQQNFINYFGEPNIQPVTGNIKGFPDFHTSHRGGNQAEIQKSFQLKLTSTLWHQDARRILRLADMTEKPIPVTEIQDAHSKFNGCSASTTLAVRHFS